MYTWKRYKCCRVNRFRKHPRASCHMTALLDFNFFSFLYLLCICILIKIKNKYPIRITTMAPSLSTRSNRNASSLWLRTAFVKYLLLLRSTWRFTSGRLLNKYTNRNVSNLAYNTCTYIISLLLTNYLLWQILPTAHFLPIS